MPANEVVIFKPNSRGVDRTFRSMITNQLVDRVGHDFDHDTAEKVKGGFSAMKRLGGDSFQFRAGDRRIRLKMGLAA